MAKKTVIVSLEVEVNDSVDEAIFAIHSVAGMIEGGVDPKTMNVKITCDNETRKIDKDNHLRKALP